MQSPYKRIVVYDLETGGLKSQFNSITEIAAVAIDMENLEVIEEFSVMLLPRLDLSYMQEESLKEAKMLYKNLAIKDPDSNVKYLPYKGERITLKNLDVLVHDIDLFQEEFYKIYPNHILELSDIQELQKSEHCDLINLYYNNSYNPEALEVTKISTDLMIDEGVSYEEAFKQVHEMLLRHTIGNSRPIIAGHNIGWLPRRISRGKEVGPNGFDNPFMEKFFKNNNHDFFATVNDVIYDTLQMARVRWYELPAYNLGTCANEVGLTLKEAHRALPDTIANAKFLIKLLKSFRGEGSQASSYKRRKFNFNY